MATCSECGKEVSFWNLCSDEKHRHICPECWNKRHEPQNAKEKGKEKKGDNNMGLTFILQKGEKILKEVAKVQYAGVTIQNIGGAIGSGLGHGLGGGLFSSQQIKREGSVFDAKLVHLYLTNKRLIFCKTKFAGFWANEERIGVPILEIEYKQIKGIITGSKLGNPSIELSMASPKGEIDNIKFWFFGTILGIKRGKERDEVLELIKKSVR